jgi:hypothetical protein
MNLNYRAKFGLIVSLAVSIIATSALFFIDPISQDLKYHDFIDNFTILQLPNFWNVVSNIPFIGVGGLALVQFNKLKLIQELKLAYLIFFSGILLVGIGSGYYHLNPNNTTLVWDRLPMTIGFMALISIIVAEYISVKAAKMILIPLILLGIVSVIYWHYTESHGIGDLRFYGLIQFLPIIIIPIIVLTHTSKFNTSKGYWFLLIAYILAKLFENYDQQIYLLTADLISGHSIKHMSAALGIYCLYSYYKNRFQISQ